MREQRRILEAGQVFEWSLLGRGDPAGSTRVENRVIVPGAGHGFGMTEEQWMKLLGFLDTHLAVHAHVSTASAIR
jgi:hypothetical protein